MAGSDEKASDSADRGDDGAGEKRREGPLRCDFCGEPAPVVRRVALDRGYERLQTPHPVRYACPRCSEDKEQRRLGLRRG
jgi:hypothetical protein